MTRLNDWRPALAAFYEQDGSKQRAINIRRGEPLDHIDLRTVKALQAAFGLLPMQSAA